LDAIPDVIAQIESYDVTTVRASTGNWLLAKKIAEQEQDTVLFCGDVADELLGGYRGFGMTTDADAFDDENVKMLENIHRFDVLRCEKSFAGHGLEARVPFADSDVVDLLMSVPPEFKMWDGCAGVATQRGVQRRREPEGEELVPDNPRQTGRRSCCTALARFAIRCRIHLLPRDIRNDVQQCEEHTVFVETAIQRCGGPFGAVFGEL
jgi:asparagine synthetase B (glutamine-hydrolysing)